MLTRRLIIAVAVIALGGACALDKQGAPQLAGPSELGLSLAISASPDLITQDGFAQSVIEVIARDASSQPVRGVQMRADMAIGGILADFGTLSSRTVSTGSDGRAQFVYTAPPAPPPGGDSNFIVSVLLTPINGNYQNAQTRSVAIRLAPIGVVLPPNGGPIADFIFSPTRPHEQEETLFDASSSRDPDGQIVSYAWSFGDGDTSSGVVAFHSYGVAADYVATLTVTDNRGLSTAVRKTVPVQVAAGPQAAFTYSPTAVKVGTNVFFNATGSTAPTGRSIVAYDWNFGDGSTATGVTPTKTYFTVGTYTVTLKVTDSAGFTSVVNTTITVTP